MEVSPEHAHERSRKSRQVYRFVNDSIEEVQARLGPTETLELLCECEDPACARKLVVPQDLYGSLRAHPERFLISTAHAKSPGGRVVEQGADYLIVEEA